MTIKQAQQELARPLVFGDELQIKALKVLNNAPPEHFTQSVTDILMDWDLSEELGDLRKDEFMSEMYNLFKEQSL